jgi:hypothetical protein
LSSVVSQLQKQRKRRRYTCRRCDIR